MGRIDFSHYLNPEDRAKLEACARRRNFYGIDMIRAELKSLGIQASRSALGRYLKTAREQQGRLSVLEQPTVVTVVDCHTGRAHTVRTGLPTETVIERIAAQNSMG